MVSITIGCFLDTGGKLVDEELENGWTRTPGKYGKHSKHGMAPIELAVGQDLGRLKIIERYLTNEYVKSEIEDKGVHGALERIHSVQIADPGLRLLWSLLEQLYSGIQNYLDPVVPDFDTTAADLKAKAMSEVMVVPDA